MRAKDKISEVYRGMGSRHRISSKLAMGTVLGEAAAAAAAEAETKGVVVEVAGIGRSWFRTSIDLEEAFRAHIQFELPGAPKHFQNVTTSRPKCNNVSQASLCVSLMSIEPSPVPPQPLLFILCQLICRSIFRLSTIFQLERRVRMRIICTSQTRVSQIIKLTIRNF